MHSRRNRPRRALAVDEHLTRTGVPLSLSLSGKCRDRPNRRSIMHGASSSTARRSSSHLWHWQGSTKSFRSGSQRVQLYLTLALQCSASQGSRYQLLSEFTHRRLLGKPPFALLRLRDDDVVNPRFARAPIVWPETVPRCSDGLRVTSP